MDNSRKSPAQGILPRPPCKSQCPSALLPPAQRAGKCGEDDEGLGKLLGDEELNGAGFFSLDKAGWGGDAGELCNCQWWVRGDRKPLEGPARSRPFQHKIKHPARPRGGNKHPVKDTQLLASRPRRHPAQSPCRAQARNCGAGAGRVPWGDAPHPPHPLPGTGLELPGRT